MANAPVAAVSNDSRVAAVAGESTAQGDGVYGKGRRGVVGESVDFQGVYGHSGTNAGVVGESEMFDGVWGVAKAPNKVGVVGIAKAPGGRGVSGDSAEGQGVYGHSVKNVGVIGESEGFDGVWGVAKAPNKAGVFGLSKAPGGRGVAGDSVEFQGVYGHSTKNAGVVGESDSFDGVWGESRNPRAAGVSGHNVAGGLAGYFEGDVVVTGDIRLVNADCAENFDVCGVERVAPGTVMVLGHEGGLVQSDRAYDRRVAGVVSGAGAYRPAIVMDQQHDLANRQPIALVGKVFCKVDACFGAIEIGDLLTTSTTPGHAMKSSDPARAPGSVIGKALRAFASGQGLIPILITLQ